MFEDGSRIYIPVAIENSTDVEVFITTKDCYLNDWQIGYYFAENLKSGKKSEDYITIRSEQRGIVSTDEVETIDMQFIARNKETMEKVMVSDLVRIYPFN